MKLAALGVLVGIVFAGPATAAQALSKEDVKAERARIEAQAKAARDHCRTLSGTARDVCRAEAGGKERVAKAELEVRIKDTPKARYDVRIAQADMMYDVARERCGERIGKAKHHCTKEARDAYDRARAEARAEREAAEKRKAQAGGEAQQEST